MRTPHLNVQHAFVCLLGKSTKKMLVLYHTSNVKQALTAEMGGSAAWKVLEDGQEDSDDSSDDDF